jgi:transcriptional regulator with XRE-family HTH domain
MEALRRARVRRGWSMTRAAAETGVSRPMISQLERGLRRPSVTLAEALITGYGMDPAAADVVRSIAIDWVGRDSPYRTGVRPPWVPSETSWDTQGNGTHRGDSTARHRADPGTGRATGRPAVSAEQWIEWARAKAEEAQRARSASD